MLGRHSFLLKFKSSLLKTQAPAWADTSVQGAPCLKLHSAISGTFPVEGTAPVPLMPEYVDPFAVNDPIW